MSKVFSLNIRGFGSVTNAMMQNTGITPEVGMGATILMHTDSYAATIVAVNSPKSINIQRDKATRIDNNGMRTFTKRKNGRWVEKGSGTMWNGTKLGIGKRKEYYDYSF